MGQRSREFRPVANGLESRLLLSVSVPRPVVPMEVATLSTRDRRGAVSGTLRGNYLATGEDLRAADAPLTVSLSGAGRVTGLGRVTMTGSLDLGGFRPQNVPDFTGTVTLTNARGSISVRLTGWGGQSQVPDSRARLGASIVGGSGAYANLRGIGSATLRFGGNTIQCVTTPCPIGGPLTLHLNLNRPIR